jgi:hypothetical protein
MPKLHKDLNQIRHLELPEALKADKKDFEIKENLMKTFRETTGYAKDENVKAKKRERFAKIRELGGIDSEKIKKLQDVLWDEEEKKTLGPVKEKKEELRKHLLNKPNMTAKDKDGMQKSIDFLVSKEMDTEENLKKLDAINYAQDHIEIG